jgi:predicted phosphoadenosine phosphosulfate sulfurtransferase
MRVPSYKALAMAILRNDHTLSSIGFSSSESPLSESLVAQKKRSDSPQENLF